MIYVTLAIAVAALACSIVALIASRKKDAVIEKETVKVEYAPVEHPFTYDEKKGVYLLDGSLEVKGGLSCLKKTKKGGKA